MMKRLSEGGNSLAQESIVERLAVEAIGLGADVLEVEYKDGYERAFAAKAGMGFGVSSCSTDSGTSYEAASMTVLARRHFESICGASDLSNRAGWNPAGHRPAHRQRSGGVLSASSAVR